MGVQTYSHAYGHGARWRSPGTAVARLADPVNLDKALGAECTIMQLLGGTAYSNPSF